MPKIISAGNSWKSVELPGEFASDTNLTFLSAFEELTPIAEDQHLNKSGIPKQLKKNGRRNRDSGIKKVKKVKGNNLTKSDIKINRFNEKKKKKKKKEEKSERIDYVDEQCSSKTDELEGESEPNSTISQHVVVNESNGISGNHKRIKRKKKKKQLPTIKAGSVESKMSRSKRVSFVDNGEPMRKKQMKSPLHVERLTTEEIGEEAEQASEEIESTSMDQANEIDLSAWTSFCLPEEIMKALNDLRFPEPTEIQRLVLPSAVRDKLDILGAAETGSGKTLAYAIPLVVRLLDEQNSDENWTKERCLRALILAPTRELVVQIRRHLDTFIKYTNFMATSIVGGLSQQKQERLLKYRPEIIVATPGRFWALAANATPLSYLANWQKLLCLVVDETDRMVEKGHFEELEYILEAIKSEGNVKRQTLVFSATLTFVHPAPRRLNVQQTQQMTTTDKINRLIEIVGLRKERKVFDITRPLGTAQTLLETRMNCSNLMEKDTNVVYLLTRYPGRTLIFMNSIDASRRLHGILSKLRYEPIPVMLHAKMIQKQRLKNLEKFAEVPNSVLLATDVAARGLDIRGVEHVIHYQVPKTAELYVHRSGRTARALHRGLTVLMVDPQDAQYYRRICRNLNREQELPIYPIDSMHLFNALKERVKVASEVESLEHRIKKIASRETWFEKAAREADLLLDDREREREDAVENLTDLRRQKKAAEGRLRAALALPLPRFDHVQVQKTRYVTPEMVLSYGKAVTRNALSSFEENTLKEQYTRKNYRVLANIRHLRHFNDKRKRKKLKRK